MGYSLKELIDSDVLQKLCEKFSKLTQAVTAILDIEGNILVATGWQDICTQFHRVNPGTACRCQESDTILAKQLSLGEKYNVYKCKNGLVDVAVPIIIGENHVGNFFTGQFFFEPPDKEYFRRQAIEFGFDQESYFEALSRVPVFSEEHIHLRVEFLCQLAEMLGAVALNKLNALEINENLSKEITERKNAEVRERSSKAYLDKILNNIGDPVFVKDEQHRFTLVNDAFCSNFGLSRDKIIGKTLAEDLPTDEMEHFLKIDRQVLTDGKENVCEELLTVKSGKTLTILTKKTRYVDKNGEKFLIGVIRDITDRKKAEEALRESEGKYRQLFELESDAIFLIEKETGTIIDANASAVALYGYSQQELLEMRNVDLSAEGDKTKQATHDQLSQIPIRYHRKKDGTVFPVEITASHLKWKGRDAHIAAIRDISFRVEAQSARTKLERDLYHSQKLESIGTLAGGIAHEFNNVLSIIIGNNELVMEELPKLSPAWECTEEIRIAGLRARDVVKQLLLFSRHKDIESVPLDIGLVTEESMKLIRSSIPANININQVISDDVAPILGNSTQINQILINLCSNAADAMMHSGGSIRISLSNVTLEQTCKSISPTLTPGEYVKLMVRDTGCGMDTITLDRIFEPFFTTKEIGKGTGIGLAVVHGIVEKQRGAIFVESEPEKGTAFTIFFPVHQGHIEQKLEEHIDIPEGSESVLFVDDEPTLVKLAQRRLEALGYRVQGSAYPQEALEIFRASPDEFDLVVTDMAMPKMTGDQLIAEILKIRPTIPTILCTGYSEKISVEKTYEFGCKALIMKPIDSTEFAIKVRKVLDNAQSEAHQ